MTKSAKCFFIISLILCSQLNAGIIETPNFKIRHALGDQEKKTFEDTIVPIMESFVAHWKQYGLELKSAPLNIIIQPEKTLDKVSMMEALYGNNYRSDLEKLKQAIEFAPDDEIPALVKDFSNDYPALFKHKDLPNEENTKEDLIKLINILQNTTRKPNIKSNQFITNGFFPIVTLGRSANLEKENHGFLSPDIVLHEISHAMHYAAWEKSGFDIQKAVVPNGVAEMIADVLPALFLNDPCHGHLLEKDPEQKCRRYLDTKLEPVSELLYGGPHEMGASVKYLIWNLFQTLGLDVLSKSMSLMIHGAPQHMLTFSSYAESTDHLLLAVLTPKSNFQTLKYAAEEMCRLTSNASPLCDDLTLILGTYVERFDNIDEAPSRRWAYIEREGSHFAFSCRRHSFRERRRLGGAF